MREFVALNQYNLPNKGIMYILESSENNTGKLKFCNGKFLSKIKNKC